MKKKWILYGIALLCMILFIILPFPASDLSLRLVLDEEYPVSTDTFYLYYETDGQGFQGDQMLTATVDAEKGIVTFRLASSLQGHLTGLRIDLPNTEQVVGIKDVTVSSAGVVKHRYHPCVFLAPENLKAQNGIRTISLVNARAKAYVGTTSEDPYLILSDPLTAQIAGMFSHYLLTRLLVCLFLIACFASYRKSLFGETQNNTSQSNTI